VVDAASVVTTHLSELLRRNAYELVGRQEVQELLGAVGREAPKLVEDVVPGTITLGELVRVVRGVLRENLSIRDLRSILEGVADAAPRSKDTAFLVEQVRRRPLPSDHRQGGRPLRCGPRPHPGPRQRGPLRKSMGQSDGEVTWRPTSPPPAASSHRSSSTRLAWRCR
jgi:flagellar biosynthesis protein FlhA